MIRRARRLAALPAAERRLLAEAALVLTAARLALALLPFRWVVRLFALRLAGAAAGEAVAGADAELAVQVGSVIDRVADRLPFRPVCLPRALAGHLMLRRRGIGCQLHLGVRMTEGALGAHAWLTVAGTTVCGGAAAASGFTPIAVLHSRVN